MSIGVTVALGALWLVGLFATYRGLADNEFAARSSGLRWHHAERWSFGWWLGTILNFLFLGMMTYGLAVSLLVRSAAP